LQPLLRVLSMSDGGSFVTSVVPDISPLLLAGGEPFVHLSLALVLHRVRRTKLMYFCLPYLGDKKMLYDPVTNAGVLYVSGS
jgi:hypothetical protein